MTNPEDLNPAISLQLRQILATMPGIGGDSVESWVNGLIARGKWYLENAHKFAVYGQAGDQTYTQGDLFSDHAGDWPYGARSRFARAVYIGVALHPERRALEEAFQAKYGFPLWGDPASDKEDSAWCGEFPELMRGAVDELS